MPSVLSGLALCLMTLVISELCLTLRNMTINVARIRRELVSNERVSGVTPKQLSAIRNERGPIDETE